MNIEKRSYFIYLNDDIVRYPTWNADVNNGEDAALQVRRIRVWAN